MVAKIISGMMSVHTGNKSYKSDCWFYEFQLLEPNPQNCQVFSRRSLLSNCHLDSFSILFVQYLRFGFL